VVVMPTRPAPAKYRFHFELQGRMNRSCVWNRSARTGLKARIWACVVPSAAQKCKKPAQGAGFMGTGGREIPPSRAI